MTKSGSLFLSSAEMDRRQRAAKELRTHYLRGLVREVRHKLSTQTRSVAVVEVSLALTLLMVGVFWAALIGWHDATEAGDCRLCCSDNTSRIALEGAAGVA
jgi:hypothetical protein